MSILDRFFGPSYAKELKTIKPLINKVNSLEAELSPLSLDGLKEKTESLKSRIKGGESVDSILPEAFALVRESAKRTLGLRHYDVQLIGGTLLHR